MTSQSLVKQDQNFLEFPIWQLSESSEKKTIIIETCHGSFSLTHAYKSPTAFDMLILLCVMKLCEMFQNFEFTIRRSKILNMAGIAKVKWTYERLHDSFLRWRNTVIQFNGNFHDGKDKTITRAIFGVLDEQLEREGSNSLYTIKLNESFCKMIVNSQYYRLVDIDIYKALVAPITRRLYELMIRTLRENVNHCVHEYESLRNKLTISVNSPAALAARLKPALAEINKKSDISVDLNRDKNIFKFKISRKVPIEPKEKQAA